MRKHVPKLVLKATTEMGLDAHGVAKRLGVLEEVDFKKKSDTLTCPSTWGNPSGVGCASGPPWWGIVAAWKT